MFSDHICTKYIIAINKILMLLIKHYMLAGIQLQKTPNNYKEVKMTDNSVIMHNKGL